MKQICIAPKPQRGLLVTAILMTVICMTSCQDETVIDPQKELPKKNAVEIPTVQNDDDDAPPKNGHGGRLIKKPISSPNEFPKALQDDAPPKNGHGGA